MAGEWLKFESNLPEKPETLAITVAMGWDDPDLTVGKLMRLFRWFDQQTVDGNARSVTPALLDRIVGAPGFVAAVAEVGWIVLSGTSVALHNFDRHNGATAKSRAQTAKRVANHKTNAVGNAEGNAPSVSEALPREEKRREERTPSASKVLRFSEFWNAWPNTDRRARKVECLKKWKAKGLDGIADAILAHVESCKSTRKWQEGFEPAPLTYLNGSHWEDGDAAPDLLSMSHSNRV